MDDTPDTGLIPIGQVTEYASTLYLERFRLRMIGDSLTDTPRLCIELTPETGIKDLESQWSIITQWRDALFVAWPSLRDELYELLMSDLDRRHRSGDSYATLAAWITDAVEEDLREYLEWQAWLYGKAERPSTPSQYLAHPRFALDMALEVMRWFGRARLRKTDMAKDGVLPAVDDATRCGALRAALDRLRNGESAFGKYPPITGAEVRERLRQWRKGGG